MSTSWTLAYEHDAGGNRVAGELDVLIRAINNGAAVRVLTQEQEVGGSEPTCVRDADTLVVRHGTVYCQNTRNIALEFNEPINDKQVMFKSESYHYYEMINTNGFRDTIRWLVGDHENKGHVQDRVGAKWFVA